MRIWSLHPKYLDTRGLVALWREGLLAQAVLMGKTKGYVQHPQLIRFWQQSSPVGAIAEYLRVVHQEAVTRGYRFDAARISRSRNASQLDVTRGQLEFEWHHLLGKLSLRDPERRAHLEMVKHPDQHPLFRLLRGCIAEWEKGARPHGRGSGALNSGPLNGFRS
jgi:hypothetical protein